MDPISLFVVQAAVGGPIGNKAYALACKAAPKVQEWIRGKGQPVNHHLQRALRISYLSATKDLLQKGADAEVTLVDADAPVWFKSALKWVSDEEHKLNDKQYVPPLPPDGWEPSVLIEPAVQESAALEAVSRLRESLADMLKSEWIDAKLGPPPISLTDALQDDWFDQINLYFADQLKTIPEVRDILSAQTLATVDIRLGILLNEFRDFAKQSSVTKPAFFAPSKLDFFVGRDIALKTLVARLAEPGAVVPLVGMPGIGKTTLATEFAHRFADQFDGIYWLNCAGMMLPAAATELSAQFGVDPTAPIEAQLRAISSHCKIRHCLLVIDGVESNDIASLIPGGRCSVLLTSRVAGLPFLARFRAPEFGVFAPAECLDLFREYLDPAEVARRESDYIKLSESLGNLPIAIAVAAGLLKSDLRYSLDRLLNETHLNTLAHGELDISKLLGTAIASVAQESRRLLAAMAVCAGSGFRLHLAAEVAGMGVLTALDHLQDLHSRSLVEVLDREKGRYRLHSLIRAEAGQDSTMRDRHAMAVEQEFQAWEERWRECEDDLADWRLAIEWTHSATPPPPERLKAFNHLAFDGFCLLHRRGRLEDAIHSMQVAETVFEKSGHREQVAASYGNQAMVLQVWGRLSEAMALAQRQQKICEETGNRELLARSFGFQGVILLRQGQLQDAMTLHQREEAIYVELGDRVGLASSYRNQAIILKEWGRLSEALTFLKREEKILEDLGDRAYLAQSYGSQALILKAWGQLKEAMDLLQREQKICEELGDRAGLASSFGSQALILETWGRLKDPMNLHQLGDKIREEIGDRSGLAASYGNQASILLGWGQLSEATELLDRQEKIYSELNDRAGLASSWGNRALIYRAQGRLKEALVLLERGAKICEELGDRTGLASSWGNQALIRKAWGELSEAMALLKQQEKVWEELGDRAHLALSYRNQALVLIDKYELEEAMDLLDRQEKICEELNDRAGLASTYGTEAGILLKMGRGRLKEAMDRLQRQEKICEELGDRDGVASSYGNQAIILHIWGKANEALDLIHRAEKINEELGDRRGLVATFGNQALILLGWGRLKEAMDMLKRQEKLCVELGDRAGLQGSYHNQATILWKWGQPNQAMGTAPTSSEDLRRIGRQGELGHQLRQPGRNPSRLRPTGGCDGHVPPSRGNQCRARRLGWGGKMLQRSGRNPSGQRPTE
jgi:tetratricopeptide (TPR) repeat protein